MTSVRAYGISGPGERIKPMTIQRRDLQPNDVLIDIAYTGICHTDLRGRSANWAADRFPFVGGHEITGTVAAIGSGVQTLALDDRVGVGCMVDSCGDCERCARGQEQFCRQRVLTYGGIDRYGQLTMGGYSTQIVVPEHFVLRIPDSLPLDTAAPLLCAGVTNFSVLRAWKTVPGSRVGVVGFGGLGHIAVQLAAAMGARVSVYSRTLDKAPDARRMGASDVISSGDILQMEAGRDGLDLVINTATADLHLDPYLALLDIGGTFVNVGVAPNPQTVELASLMAGRRSLAASTIGGIPETQDLLDFTADHRIAAQIELIDAADIESAFESLEKGDVRYRFVVDAASI